MQTKRIITALLIAALLPFIWLCFQALPFADDFCFGWTASQPISFAQKFLNQYLLWNGRYTSDVLVNLHPLKFHSLLLYRICLAVNLLLTPVVLFLFLRTWIRDAQTAIILSLAITLIYLNYQPNVTEGMYWYIGVVNYHVGALALLLHMVVLRGKSSPLRLTLGSFLLIVAIGCNEIAAVAIPMGYLIYYLLGRRNRGSNLRKIELQLALAVIASLLVIFSPGNEIRGNQFPDRHQFFHSLYYSALQTVRFTGQWLLNIPTIILSLVAITYAGRISGGRLKLNLYAYIIAALGIVFLAAFIPYFATGTLGQHRTMNYVYLLFLLLWFLFLTEVSLRYQWKFSWLNTRKTLWIIALGFISFFVTGNMIKVISDMKHERFAAYHREYKAREESIQKNGAIIPPLKTVPFTFNIVDTKSDSTYWVDKCISLYYHPPLIGK